MQRKATAEDRFTPEDWTQAHGPRVARMFPGASGRGSFFEVDVLKRSDMKLVMKFRAKGGDCVVKAYNPGRVDAINRFRREVPVLLSLRGHSLVPKIRGYSQDHSFFVSENVRRSAPMRCQDDERLDRKCWALGNWFARYEQHAAVRDYDSDWFAYLSKYEALAEDGKLLRHMDFLKSLKINKLSIAKNDAELSNFLEDAEGRLLGVDFEAAAFKPAGWDILLTARVLARLVPARFDAALDALLAGWTEDVASTDAKGIKKLAQLFVSMTAFRALPLNRPISEVYLERYNTKHPGSAKSVFLTPCVEAKLVRPQRAEIARLRRHIWKQAEKACAVSETEIDGSDFVPQPVSPSSIKPFCAACRGKCCGKGLEKHAFLNPRDIACSFDQGVSREPAAVTDYYLSHLPDTHVDNSCLFHTSKGCNLPPAVRSGVCNGYVCQSANDFLIESAVANISEPVLLVSCDGHDPKRTAILQNGALTKVGLETIR